MENRLELYVTMRYLSMVVGRDQRLLAHLWLDPEPDRQSVYASRKQASTPTVSYSAIYFYNRFCLFCKIIHVMLNKICQSIKPQRVQCLWFTNLQSPNLSISQSLNLRKLGNQCSQSFFASPAILRAGCF